MTHHSLSTHHRSNPLLVVSTLLAAVGCILLTACTTSVQKDDDISLAPRHVTLSGTSVCLPHRDASGPQTMECAFGLETSDGSFYALNLSVLETDSLMDFPTNEVMTLGGTLVPLDDIDEHVWKTYDIVGQMVVTSVLHEA